MRRSCCATVDAIMSTQPLLLLLGHQFCRSGCLAALSPRPLQHSRASARQGRSFRCQARARRRTGVRPARSFPPPGPVCRHYVLPRRFMQTLWPRSLLPGPNSTNIVWSCCSRILFFRLFSKTAFTVILLYICLRTTPNQQHQNQYQRSAVLPGRFSRSHAIIGSCFFPPRFCAAYYTSYPASSALTRKEPSSAEETAQSQLLSKWLTTARKTMIIPVATCVRK